jgi:hypothetical protein
MQFHALQKAEALPDGRLPTFRFTSRSSACALTERSLDPSMSSEMIAGGFLPRSSGICDNHTKKYGSHYTLARKVGRFLSFGRSGQPLIEVCDHAQFLAHA